MVQQEVKKKTRIYGTAAVLAAIVLVSLIFVFGATPGFLPLTGLQNVSGMKVFADETALRNYLVANTKGTSSYAGGPLDSKYLVSDSGLSGLRPPSEPAPAPSPTLATPGAESTSQDTSHSTTNIQVAGVDEADIVKNDGSYLYVSSSDYTNNQHYVYIVKAGPQDPRVIAKITLDNNTNLAGMYLSQDSSKLIVIGSQYGDLIAFPQPAYVGGSGGISVYSY